MNIEDTDYPISEYLQLVEVNKSKFVQCKWCGETICHEREEWKDEVPYGNFPVSKAGPFRAENGQFVLKEFYCPTCATLLDTEILLKGESHLNDEIFW